MSSTGHERCRNRRPPARRRARPGSRRLADARGLRRAGGGRPRRRLRAVRRPRAAARRPDPARVGQHRRGRPGPVRARPRARAARRSPSCPAATPGSSGWRRRSSRRPRIRRTPTSRSASCRESAPCRPWRRGPAPRSAATSRSSRLSDRLKPWSVVERRLRAIAEADLVLAIYNPASRSRTAAGRPRRRRCCWSTASRDTVVVVGRDIGRAEESLTVTTLAELDPATIDMKCLLIVGAESTRVSAGRASGRRASSTGRGPGRRGATRRRRTGRAPADHDHRGLPEPGRLDLVGDVGQRAAQHQLVRLGGPGDHGDRAVRPVGRGELGQPARGSGGSPGAAPAWRRSRPAAPATPSPASPSRRACVRVRITVWATCGHGQLAAEDRGRGGVRGHPGGDVPRDAGPVEPTGLLGQRGVERRVARAEPGDVLARPGAPSTRCVGDLVQVEVLACRSGVASGGQCDEHLGVEVGAGVDADRRRRRAAGRPARSAGRRRPGRRR